MWWEKPEGACLYAAWRAWYDVEGQFTAAMAAFNGRFNFCVGDALN